MLLQRMNLRQEVRTFNSIKLMRGYKNKRDRYYDDDGGKIKIYFLIV